MISVRGTLDCEGDELPFTIYKYGECIAEPAAFLNQLLLRGISKATIRAYAYDLLSFFRFISAAGLSLPSLAQQHAIDFVTMLKKSGAAPRTINRRIAAVKSFLNSQSQGSGDAIFASSQSAFYRGRRNTALIGPSRIKQQCHRTLRIKVPSTIKMPLQTATVHSFFRKLRTLRDRAIVALMLCAGLRSCEILRLQTHDIDFDALQIRVWGKGNKERLLPVSPWIKSSIQNYLAFERPSVAHTTCFVVLKGPHRGQSMSPEGLRKIFRHRRQLASLKEAHAHRFRHTFCTSLIRQKVPLPVVQKLMGHASIDTTLIYINLSMEDVAAEYHRAMDELARIDAGE